LISLGSFARRTLALAHPSGAAGPITWDPSGVSQIEIREAHAGDLEALVNTYLGASAGTAGG